MTKFSFSGADPGYDKGGAQGIRGLNFGDFLKNLAQKGVGVRPPPPLNPRLFFYVSTGSKLKGMNKPIDKHNTRVKINGPSYCVDCTLNGWALILPNLIAML